LIQAVQPDAVVVELCKSRTGVLQSADDLQQQQQQQQLAEHQQRWQQQWQQWQQRKNPQQQESATDAVAAADSSSTTSSLEEDAASTTAANQSSSTNSSSSQVGMWQQLRASMSASRLSKASNPLSLSGPDPVRALARSASLGGQQAMLLRLLIAGQARKAAGEKCVRWAL
jgi:hypothetical protein